MAKGRFSSHSVKSHHLNDKLVEALASSTRVIVGIDVAKTKQYAAFTTDDRVTHAIVSFNSPSENERFIELLLTIRAGGPEVVVVVESTGTYDRALRYLSRANGFEVYRLNPVLARRAAELLNGSPGMHDPKAAEIIARLHLDGATNLWTPSSKHERALAALTNRGRRHDLSVQRLTGQLHSIVVWSWPELDAITSITGAAILSLLERFGSPAEVVGNWEAAESLLRRVGRGNLNSKLSRIKESAEHTQGVRMVAEEADVVRELARELQYRQSKQTEVRARIGELVNEIPSAFAQAQIVGTNTAAQLTAHLGEPAKYGTARAFVKAAGLNLSERSSGLRKGRLRITKRGPGQVRRLLYMAVLRWMQECRFVRAWFDKCVARNGGHGRKAIVALMRKLMRVLWAIGRTGEEYDPARVFDVARLGFEPEAAM